MCEQSPGGLKACHNEATGSAGGHDGPRYFTYPLLYAKLLKQINRLL